MNVNLTMETLEAARRGDAEACLVLTRAWAPTVLGWCIRLGCPEPEDAAHEVFITVLTKLGTLLSLDRFPGWLMTVTRREVARRRRKAWFHRWVAGFGALIAVEDPSPGPAARGEDAEIVRQVRAALDALPEASRVVLVLCDIEERTDEEVSVLLGIPKGTVKSRLHVARKRFADEARSRRLHEAVAAFSEGGRR